MRVSQTQRSLSNKRNLSQNQSTENIDGWDNVGLLNNRLTSLQQLKAPVFRKYQGDKILEHRRKSTYDDGILLPSIDMSLKLNNTINMTSMFAKKHPVQLFPTPIKKEIKSDKIKLLVMLSQLRKEYQKENKPTQTVCLLLQEVLEILQNYSETIKYQTLTNRSIDQFTQKRQDNIYGDDMKILFSIINDMIFCVQQDVIECVQKIQVNSQKKFSENLAIKPYFELINIMKEEIERHNNLAFTFQKKLENEIINYQNLLKQSEQKFQAVGESQRNEIELIKKNHQDEINIMEQKINSINEELQRAVKENSTAREYTEKWKNKYEDQEKRFIDQIQQTADFQGKFQEYKTLFEQNQLDLENLEVSYTQISREKQNLEEMLNGMTPRPNFHVHNLFESIGGFNTQEFNVLRTYEKLEFLKEKIEEKTNEVAELQDQKNSKLKKKGSRILGVFVQTKRQNSNADEKLSQGGGFGSQKNLDKSPTRKKLSDQKKQESTQNSPTSQTRISQKEINGQQENIVRRNMKKSSTYVSLNKNAGNYDRKNSLEELDNTPNLKNQPRSQVVISQLDQYSNFSTKSKQTEERRVQFKQQLSGSEQDSPSMKFNKNRFSNIN